MDLVQASVPKRTSVYDPAEGWAGKQGADYAVRNPTDPVQVDRSYTNRYGITRTEVNQWALQEVPRDATVLEVGCSHGAQLNHLATIGFTSLEGCDVSAEALAKCKWPTRLADGRRLPYDDQTFDMVMTAGTLMQIPPGAKKQFMAECYRVSKRWVYGVEAASPDQRTWTFGDLIPPAWTDHVPETIIVDGWKIVRSRWLHCIRDGGYSMRAYLLERE